MVKEIAKNGGSEQEQLEAFRTVRDEIKAFVEALPEALPEALNG